MDIPENSGEIEGKDTIKNDEKTSKNIVSDSGKLVGNKSNDQDGENSFPTKESGHKVENKLTSKTVKSKSNEESQPPIDEANLHYENGICIYTEPESKCQFVWEEEKQEWVPRNSPDTFSDKNYEYDGQKYTYTNQETNIKYSWDVEKNEWQPIDCKDNKSKVEVKEKDGQEEEDEDDENSKNKTKDITKQDMTKGLYSFENNTHIYTDPSDNSKYFWDKDKNAWIPKVDDDFLAQYQMNYGFVEPNENESKPEEKNPDPPPQADPETLKRKGPQEPTWFDVGEESTKVYVSGLPLDINETEFVDVMQKFGLVMRDLDSGKMKVKIYLDPETSLPKGDALCTYIKKESVDLALNLLDGYDLRGHRLTVERAKFIMKGNAYDPTLKPKKKRKKDKEKMKKIQEKLFDWRPDKMRGERSKHESIVIVKNLFDPAIFNKDVKLILEYQQDLREECLKCGSVKKVIIYDRHQEGVAQISFKEVEAADACVQLLNGRWFGQRKITAETWDGKTKYKITETDEQIKARLEKWEKFLESGGAAKQEEEKKKADLEKKAEEKVDSKEDSSDSDEEKDTSEDKEKEKKKADLEKKAEEKVDSKEDSSDSDEEKDKSEDKDSEETKMEQDEKNRDSDENTRSSVGSDYDTDDESKKA